MKTYMLSQSLYTDDSLNTDTVGGCMVMGRAIEIATTDGRSSTEISKTDLDKAKMELMGEAD